MKYYNLIGQLCVVHNYRAAAHVYLWLLLTCHYCTCAPVYITHVCLGYVSMVITFQSGMYKSHGIHSVLYVSHDDQPLLGIHIRATYAIISLQISLQNK